MTWKKFPRHLFLLFFLSFFSCSLFTMPDELSVLLFLSSLHIIINSLKLISKSIFISSGLAITSLKNASKLSHAISTAMKNLFSIPFTSIFWHMLVKSPPFEVVLPQNSCPCKRIYFHSGWPLYSTVSHPFEIPISTLLLLIRNRARRRCQRI